MVKFKILARAARHVMVFPERCNFVGLKEFREVNHFTGKSLKHY